MASFWYHFEMRYWEYLWVIIVFLSTATLGALYSVHHTDPHHWGYITSMILDYEHGKVPFKDFYVQYGMGQLFLFDLIKSQIPTSMTTIGWVTVIFYSLSLVGLYIALKNWAGIRSALLMSLVSVLIHSYSIYPWPDYYSGFFLLMSFWLITARSSSLKIGRFRGSEVSTGIVVGGLWFVAVIFRNSYLLNIGVATSGFLFLAAFSRFRFLRTDRILSAIGTFYFFFSLIPDLLKKSGSVSKLVPTNPWRCDGGVLRCGLSQCFRSPGACIIISGPDSNRICSDALGGCYFSGEGTEKPR
jgi:hypothetical protein